MTIRKFRALTDGPGWKRGDIFQLSEWTPTCETYSRNGFDLLPHLDIAHLQPPYFEEIKPRKVAIYEMDAMGASAQPELLWINNRHLKLVRVEDREA